MWGCNCVVRGLSCQLSLYMLRYESLEDKLMTCDYFMHVSNEYFVANSHGSIPQFLFPLAPCHPITMNERSTSRQCLIAPLIHRHHLAHSGCNNLTCMRCPFSASKGNLVSGTRHRPQQYDHVSQATQCRATNEGNALQFNKPLYPSCQSIVPPI